MAIGAERLGAPIPEESKKPDLKLVKKPELIHQIPENQVLFDQKLEKTKTPEQEARNKRLNQEPQKIVHPVAENEVLADHLQFETPADTAKPIESSQPQPKEHFNFAEKISIAITGVKMSGDKQARANAMDNLCSLITKLMQTTDYNEVAAYVNKLPRVEVSNTKKGLWGRVKSLFGSPKEQTAEKIYQEAFYQATAGMGRETQLTGGTVSKAQTRGDLKRGEVENQNWGKKLN